MAKSKLPVRIGIGSILVVAAGSVAVWMVRLPAVGAQMALPSGFFILEPANEAILLIDDAVMIQAQAPGRAFGTGNKFELWVDGILNTTETFYIDSSGVIRFSTTPEYGGSTPIGPGRSDLPPGYVHFQWRPEVTGEHTLSVRVVGPAFTQNSDVVNVIVVDPAAPDLESRYHPQAGDTLLRVAAKFGLPPLLLGAANPQIPNMGTDLTSPPYDGNVLVPLGLPANGVPGNGIPTNGLPADGLPPDGVAIDPAAAAPNKLGLWLSVHVFSPLSPAAHLPPAPILLRSVLGCDVNLYIRDNSSNELGFFVYRQDPGATTYTRIATLGPHKGVAFIEYDDKGLYGDHSYYVSAFNALGESASNLISVSISDTICLDPAYAAMKFDFIGLTTNIPADKAYCYYSLQQGPWSRVPESPDAFVYPTDDGFDLTRVLSDVILPMQGQLNLDCWGWQGGALVHLGSLQGTFPPPGSDRLMRMDGDGLFIGISLVIFQLAPDRFPPGAELSVIKIMPPVGLTRTNLLDVCAGHLPLGSSSPVERAKCTGPITDGQVILVWDWMPSCVGCKDPLSYLTKIDGYKIYRLLPGSDPVLIATVTGQTQTVYITPGLIVGGQYYVRAFSGPYLSPRSNIYTLSDLPPGFASVAVSPTVYQQVIDTPVYRTTPCSIPLGGLSLLGGVTYGPTVGFMHASYTSGCLASSDHFYRGRLAFDLSAVSGYVFSARLHFAPSDTKVDGKTDSLASCAQNLSLITAVSGDEAASFASYLALPKTGKLGYSFTFDVTDAVRNWVEKLKPNLGFLLVGQESGFTKSVQSCLSEYNSFGLDINYFIK